MTVTIDPYTVTGKFNRTTAGDTVHTFTPSLNPHRLPEIMSPEIFELLVSQAHLISGELHKDLLYSTAQNAVLNQNQNQNQNHPGIRLSASFSGLSILNENGDQNTLNYAEVLWKDSEARSRVLQKPRTFDPLVLQSLHSLERVVLVLVPGEVPVSVDPVAPVRAGGLYGDQLVRSVGHLHSCPLRLGIRSRVSDGGARSILKGTVLVKG
jgi:hypothetical protein